MTPSELCKAIAETIPDLFRCSPAPQHGVRVRTPLLYPDGGVIDVFVATSEGRCTVSDRGEALGWLRTRSTSERRSPGKEQAVRDACQTLCVELRRGELVLRTQDGDAIGESVLRLAQAVARVSDRCFTLGEAAIGARPG